MAKKNTEIVKNGANPKDIIISVPDDYSMDIDRSDIKIPSILLWQKMSDMAEFEGENVKAGDFVNPVTGDIYGSNFEGAVIRYYTTARVYGEKGEDGRKEVVKYSRDGVHWDNDGSIINPSEFRWTDDGSHAVKSYHYLVLPKGSTIPSMLTFKGSSAKFAKALNANLMFMRPSWRSWFKYHVVQAKAQPKMMGDEASASIALELWASTGQSVVSSADMDKNHEAEDFDANKVNY